MQTGVASLAAQSFLNTNAALNSTFNQLSSGVRISSAAGDAARLTKSDSTNMRIATYASTVQPEAQPPAKLSSAAFTALMNACKTWWPLELKAKRKSALSKRS
jgi:hypothetical protein